MNLGARRAAKSSDPAEISIRDLLLSVIDDIDTGKLNPAHIMVISVMEHEDGDVQTQIDHAGSLKRYAQYGILAPALGLLRDAK